MEMFVVSVRKESVFGQGLNKKVNFAYVVWVTARRRLNMVDWVQHVYPGVVALLCVYVGESFGLFCVLNFWDNQIIQALLVFLFKILETQVNICKYLLFLIFKLVSVGI